MKKYRPIVLGAVVAGAVAWGVWHWRADHDFLYAGTIEATEVDLSSRLTSVIAAYDVRESDMVKTGQVLVRMTCEEQTLAAEIAEKDFQRTSRLLRSDSIPQETFDRMKFARDDAALKKSWCTVVSPLSGKVLEKYMEAGERVNPGAKLLTLADLSDVYAYVYVSQPSLAALKLGMEVTGLLPEMPGRPFAGRITHLRDEAEFTPKNVQTRDERTRLVYGVKIAFANAEEILKPGMTIEVRLPQ